MILPAYKGTWNKGWTKAGAIVPEKINGKYWMYYLGTADGADDKLVYRLGWVLFDKNDPTKVVKRANIPIFVPEKEWELKGQVPNVVFVEGMIQEKDRLLLYYGGADSVTGVAEVKLVKAPGTK